MSNSKTITYTLTDKTNDDRFKAIIYAERKGEAGREVYQRYPNNEHEANRDSAIVQAMIAKVFSSRYDYGNEKVVGVFEGRFASDHCSVERAVITLTK